MKDDSIPSLTVYAKDHSAAHLDYCSRLCVVEGGEITQLRKIHEFGKVATIGTFVIVAEGKVLYGGGEVCNILRTYYHYQTVGTSMHEQMRGLVAIEAVRAEEEERMKKDVLLMAELLGMR